jgi:uncharacterized protein (DUF1778 family)
MKKVKQTPVRINLSFTQEEFDCINEHANNLDMSLSGFIYSNMKMSAAMSSLLGHKLVREKYIELIEELMSSKVFESLDAQNKTLFFSAISQANDIISIAGKLQDFGGEWIELRLLK